MDRYSKFVLTAIAIALWGLLFSQATVPLLASASLGEKPTEVKIVDPLDFRKGRTVKVFCVNCEERKK